MDRFLIHKNPLAGLKLGLPALLFGVAMCFTQVVLADAACDAEIAAIQSALDTPSASISSDNLQQAQQLFKVLTEDCGGGTPIETAAPIVQQIRSLLAMGEAK